MRAKEITIAALLLGTFGLLGSALVTTTFDLTRERIAANERATLLRRLNVLIPQDQYDNDLFGDTLQVVAPHDLGTSDPVTVYRARRNGQPVALVLDPVAPDGYGGDIRLLIAIRTDGTLVGVRVVSHKETPGLGDAIEASRSDWIHGFAGYSLDALPPEGWALQRDGGVFDQFTGASITPRAVVKAVYRALLYFDARRAKLFAKRESAATPAVALDKP